MSPGGSSSPPGSKTSGPADHKAEGTGSKRGQAGARLSPCGGAGVPGGRAPLGAWSAGFQAEQSREGSDAGEVRASGSPFEAADKDANGLGRGACRGLESAFPLCQPVSKPSPTASWVWGAPLPLSCWPPCGRLHTHFICFILHPSWGPRDRS